MVDWGQVFDIGGNLVGAYGQWWGGQQSADDADWNAGEALRLAGMNASSLRDHGMQQAALYNMAGRYNADLILKQSQLNVDARYAIASFNSELTRQVSSYNSLLYGAELDSLFDSYELDSELLHIAMEKSRGAAVAKAASSGTVLNVGSNQDVVANIIWEEELEQLVLDRNRQNRTMELLNASTRSAWDAEATARKIEWEAEIAGVTDMLNASLMADAEIFNSGVQGQMSMIDANSRATEAMNLAQSQSSNYGRQADYYRTSGNIKAGSSLLGGVGTVLDFIF